jgi:HD superfamily phosphohydrolase
MPGATVLRDAVWGDIALGPPELVLIDTAHFQRLRRVKQLGVTDLVFPGARHTRFEHSIGVFHLGRLVLGRLRSLPKAPDITEADERAFLAAALLHDIGHYPFSHALEELEIDQISRHTEIARELITGPGLAPILDRAWDVDARLVATLVAGSKHGDPQLTEGQALLRSVLDSSLDVDKLDYLVRDARGANVPYGVVDVQRLIGALTVWREDERPAALAVESRGVSALQSLVFAKHLMFATVYWHHACRSGVVMLLRAVQEALRRELIAAPQIERSDDDSLLSALAQTGESELCARLARRLHDRQLYKRAIELGMDDASFDRLERLWFHPTQRIVLEDGWASSVGAEPGDVLLDIPEPRRIAVDLPVVVDDGEASDWDRVSGLGTDDLDRFQRWVRSIRVFAASHELAARVRAERGALF